MISYRDFPKIDAHFHSTSYDPIYERIARDHNVRYININTDARVFPLLEEQESVALKYTEKHKKYFSYITSFEMNNWDSEGWYDKTINRISDSIGRGAVGVKIWKNIGMEIIKPTDHSFIMIDDEFFDPLFSFLIDNKIPVLAHLGEPKNCWLPLEEMTTDRNRTYFATHPEFHAYKHPEIPSYESQIQARDNVLEKFPNLIFVGAHFGSLEWSYQEVAARLDTFPNFYVDVASRMGNMLLQSVDHHKEVREFFIKYDDRIIYGTDAYNNPEKLTNALYNNWQFLATNNDCKSTEVNGTYVGINLPEASLRKIYFDNAAKVYHRLSFKKIDQKGRSISQF